MHITREKRMEIYNTLPESIKILYSSKKAAALNGTLIEKYNLDEQQADAFLDATGDVILGFYKINELPQLLKAQVGVDDTDAQKITTDMLDFLEPIIQHEDKNTLQKNEMLNLADSFAQKATVAEPAAETTKEAPKKQGAVSATHTMEDDMNRVHGYGTYRHNNPREDEEVVQSNQDALLKKDE